VEKENNTKEITGRCALDGDTPWLYSKRVGGLICLACVRNDFYTPDVVTELKEAYPHHFCENIKKN